jgi:hypothetical protein
MTTIKRLATVFAATVLSLAASSAHTANAVVTRLMTKPLPEFPDREAQMITVEYPSGAVDPVHRHDAHAFVCVLECSIVRQVKGGQEITLQPGQTFRNESTPQRSIAFDCSPQALGCGRDGARYIKNVIGQGYCFVAPVVRGSYSAMPATGPSHIARKHVVRPLPPLQREE